MTTITTTERMTEPQMVTAWTTILKPHFDIEHEVWGQHLRGDFMRIDMILHPKFEWKGGGNFPIGFEIKGQGTNEAKLIGQAADYANTRWNSVKYDEPVDMFIAVHSPMYQNRQFCETHGIILTEQMLGRLGIAHFDIDNRYGLTLRVSGQRVWSHLKGSEGPGWSAKRKFGSR